MCADAAAPAGETGMKLVEEHVPGLYSLRSVVYIAVCFLVPFVPIHLINRVEWWSPLISAAMCNALVLYLMSRLSWNEMESRQSLNRGLVLHEENNLGRSQISPRRSLRDVSRRRGI